MRYLISLTFMIILIAYAIANDNKSIMKIKTPEDAVVQAIKYSGFPVLEKTILENANNVSTTMLLNDSTTPFIHNLINNRSAWRVIFKNVILDHVKSDNNSDTHIAKDFYVYIDSESGRLLKIISQESDSGLMPEPLYNIAEKQMQDISQYYMDIPDSLPVYTFYDCLNKCVGSYSSSKVIFGYYVLFKSRQIGPIPVWAITLKGFPPDDIVDPDGTVADWIPEHYRYIWRNIINANTGEFINATNIPHMTSEEKNDK